MLLLYGRLFQVDGRTIDVAAGLLRGLSETGREQGGRDSIHGRAMETPAPRRKERREKRERFMGGGSGWWTTDFADGHGWFLRWEGRGI